MHELTDNVSDDAVGPADGNNYSLRYSATGAKQFALKDKVDWNLEGQLVDMAVLMRQRECWVGRGDPSYGEFGAWANYPAKSS